MKALRIDRYGTAAGRDVQRLKPGDEVFGDLCLNGFGTFAEYVCAPESAVAIKPASMSPVQAAALPHAGTLAYQGLFDAGDLASRKRLLINGAGGGVGTLALQMALQHDVEITAVDAADKLDMLRRLGAHHVIDYRAQDFTGNGREYDLILDTRTTRSPFQLARSLTAGGTYATVGGSIPRVAQVAALGPLMSRTRGRRLRVVAQKPNRDLQQLAGWFLEGKLLPVLDTPFSLAQASQALARFGRAEHRGKIVLEVPW